MVAPGRPRFFWPSELPASVREWNLVRNVSDPPNASSGTVVVNVMYCYVGTVMTHQTSYNGGEMNPVIRMEVIYTYVLSA